MNPSLTFAIVVVHGAHGRLEVRRRLLLDLVRHGVDLEAVEPRHELVRRPLGTVLWVHHEEHVREPGAEVRAVDVVVPRRLGRVNVATFGAVEFHHRLAWYVAQAYG